MISRFLLMENSEVKDEDGEFFPDVLTFPLNDFEFKGQPLRYILNAADLQRIDVLMNEVYNVPVYDDIVLFLSDIPYLGDLNDEDDNIVILPVKTDLDNFVSNNRI